MHDLAPLHDIDAIGDFEGQRQVLLGDQDCKPHLVPQPGDEVTQDPYDLRRQSFRRLVQQQQARAGHQGASDGEHLLLTAGQSAPGRGGPDAQGGKQRIDFGEVAAP